MKKRASKRVRKPTVSDVAANAGVSTATVSRCLSKPDLVRTELRKRVEASIFKLGYVLDGAAKALKTDKSETIGIIVPTLEIGSFATAVQAFQRKLYDNGYSMILAVSDFKVEKEMHLARNLAQRGVDGMMLIGQSSDNSVTDFLDKIGIPHVGTWNVGDDPACPMIGFDSRAGMRQMTEYVLGEGHRDLVLIVGGGPHANPRSVARIAGFEDALRGQDLPITDDMIFEMPYHMTSGQMAFEEIWQRSRKPTAIVCASDIFALGVLRACRERDISIPGELSLTGFDGIEIMTDLSVPITSISVPAREMGEAAAAYLLGRLKGKPQDSLVEFPCRLKMGGSVRSLKR